DGSAVLFRSMRYGWDLSDTRLYLAPIEGGLPTPLAMPVSGGGDLSPDGTRVAYSPLARDFRTWKRHEGGWAQDLYIFDLESHDLEQVTDHVRSDRDPMWIRGKIFFSSDRDGTLNLYSYDTRTKVLEQLTTSDVWDVRWPSDDGDHQIVYELNGELQIYDIGQGASKPLSIEVPDDGLAKRPKRLEVADYIEDFALSPKGERALFIARGDVFSAPIEKGRTRNLTQTSGAHDKWARWSPDGKQIAFISDMTGEEEIYLVSQDGTGEPVQLTEGGQAMRYAPEWSPDGSRLAFSDKGGKLFVLEVDTREVIEIADEARGQIRDYTWSPNGGHVAFSMTDINDFGSIYIWSVADRQLHRVTSEMFHDFEPVWDPDGKYLYYFANREYAPQISSIEWNFATDRETYIYALALREDVEHPLPPESDEVTIDEEKDNGDKEENGDEEEENGEEKAKDPIGIDFDGLAGRVARIPVDADNFGGLTAASGYLLYVKGAPFYYGRSADTKSSLQLFSFEDREASTLAEDISGYALSGDGKKVLVRHGSSYKLYDVKKNGKDSAKAVSTAGLVVDLVPEEEWAQIFDEVWRRNRDFFYVENMHGYDWEALREQYRPWLEHVGHRSDLNYLVGEMIAELNVGHTYKAGGDYEIPDRQPVALLGAELEQELEPDTTGRYRFAKILRGQNEEDKYRSPLTEIGVDVDEGDYLLAIDGVELTAETNPYQLLRNKTGHPVELTVNDQPILEGARKVSINPITNEAKLRYLDWVEANWRKVDELTDGRVGYIHVPDMGGDGISEFIKWYYPQLRKEGLVVDVRSNGGGNVSQMLIERLRRSLLGTGFNRNSDTPETYPATTFYGHMVCLIDEDSASDGDIFPHFFRQAGIGPLIGKRTWGGVTGITGRGPLIDGAAIYVPEFGTNAIDGSWIIEGHGVEPDIEVENDAKSILEGRDPQLERGVEEVLRMIDADPKKLPERPAPPIKTK
ncbi:MAG: peptidase S41, partial [Acidobacteria bacterium]